LGPNYVKKRLDLCGEALVDFINADSTDEACLSLIPKIQIEYKFSANFEKKARNTFPRLVHILEHIEDELHQWHKRIIDLQFKYWTELDLIGNAVYNLMLFADDYDFRKDKLILENELNRKKIFIPLKGVDKNYNKIEKKL